MEGSDEEGNYHYAQDITSLKTEAEVIWWEKFYAISYLNLQASVWTSHKPIVQMIPTFASNLHRHLRISVMAFHKI